MNINKILFDRYKREFYTEDIVKIIRSVNNAYFEEMSDEANEMLDTGWVTISYDTNPYKYESNSTFNKQESLQDKLLNTKDMLEKALLEEEYQLAAKLKKLVYDIEDEINKNK